MSTLSEEDRYGAKAKFWVPLESVVIASTANECGLLCVGILSPQGPLCCAALRQDAVSLSLLTLTMPELKLLTCLACDYPARTSACAFACRVVHYEICCAAVGAETNRCVCHMILTS
jgi:hypothetical protein